MIRDKVVDYIVMAGLAVLVGSITRAASQDEVKEMKEEIAKMDDEIDILKAQQVGLELKLNFANMTLARIEKAVVP